jgi:hypothetical protein
VGVLRRRPALLPLPMMPPASGAGELTTPAGPAEFASVINSEGAVRDRSFSRTGCLEAIRPRLWNCLDAARDENKCRRRRQSDQKDHGRCPLGGRPEAPVAGEVAPHDASDLPMTVVCRRIGGPLLEARGRHFGHSHAIGNAIDARLRWRAVALEQSMKVKRMGCLQRQSGRKSMFPAARHFTRSPFFKTSRRCADDAMALRGPRRALPLPRGPASVDRFSEHSPGR